MTQRIDRRTVRLEAEAAARKRLSSRAAEIVLPTERRRSAVGLKRWFVPGSENILLGIKGRLTPYAAKERARRRAARRVAHESRRINHRRRIA